MPVLLKIRHLEEEDLEIEGLLPASELQLEAVDELVHIRRPLHYDLTARLAGSDIMVSGELEVTLDCECARCLKPFEQRLVLPEWSAQLPLEGPEQVSLKDDAVDLTPWLREDILLEFPQHPLCDAGCAGLPNRLDSAGKKTERPGQTPDASAWASLNKLKF